MSKEFDEMTAEELRALAKRAEEAAGRKHEEGKAKARDAVLELVKKAGYTMEDLFPGVQTRKRSSTKRAPSEVKFRNKNNPDETWSGRGRKPDWIKNLDDGLENHRVA